MTNLSRRKLITTGLATAAGVTGLGLAARLAQRQALIPPDHGGFYGVGETLNYASHRLLTRHSLAREFPKSQISKIPVANEIAPPSEAFRRLQAGGFADWRLSVSGMVDRPASFSLAHLNSYPSRSQITQLVCEEGWSYIAEWIGGLSPMFWKWLEFSRKRNTWFTPRSIPAGGIASIWPMPCIRRLFSPMA